MITATQADRLAAFLARIEAFTEPVLAVSMRTPTVKERALALLLDQVGALIKNLIEDGRPVGLLPFRVNTLLDAIDAEAEVVRNRPHRMGETGAGGS